MQALAVAIAAGIAKSTNHCYRKCSFKEVDLAVALAPVLATAYAEAQDHKCTSARPPRTCVRMSSQCQRLCPRRTKPLHAPCLR